VPQIPVVHFPGLHFQSPPYSCVCLFLLLKQTVAPEDDGEQEENPQEEIEENDK